MEEAQEILLSPLTIGTVPCSTVLWQGHHCRPKFVLTSPTVIKIDKNKLVIKEHYELCYGQDISRHISSTFCKPNLPFICILCGNQRHTEEFRVIHLIYFLEGRKPLLTTNYMTKGYL